MSTMSPSAVGLSSRTNSLRAAVLCLGGCALAALVGFTAQAHIYAMVALMAVGVGVPVWHGWSRNRLDYFEPIHLLGLIWFVYFGLGAIWVIHDPQHMAYDLYIVPFIPRATLYCLLGMAALLIGYYGPWHRRVRRQVEAEWPRGVGLALIVGGLGFVGQVAAAYWVLASDIGRRLPWAFSSVAQLAPLFLFCWALMWIVFFSGQASRAQRAVLFGVLVPAALLVGYLTIRDKSLAMSMAGIPVIARWYAGRKIPWTVLLVLLLALIFVVFPLYNTFRFQDPNLSQSDRLVATYRAIESWDARRFNQFTLQNFKSRLAMINSVAIVVRDVGRWVPYARGETILMPTIAFLVPRFLWADKPTVTSGREFGRTFRVTDWRTRTTNIGATIPGELYWNFDVPGIVFGMLLFGIAIRWLYRRYGDLGRQVSPVPHAIHILVLVEMAHIIGAAPGPAVAGVTRLLVVVEVVRWISRRAGLTERLPLAGPPLGENEA